MFLFDKVLSALPLFIILYFGFQLWKTYPITSKEQEFAYIRFRNPWLFLTISNLLKFIFKKKRKIKRANFAPWPYIQHLKPTASNFGFPSNHTMIYVGLYLDSRNPIFFVILMLGVLSRIYYEHHTVLEVLHSLEISMLFKTISESFLIRASTNEINFINKLLDALKHKQHIKS